jgi:hypothetical protein
VIQEPSFFLGEDDDTSRPVGEPLKHRLPPPRGGFAPL